MAWRATILFLSLVAALLLVIAGRGGEASETRAEVDQSTDSRCQVSFTIWRVEDDGTRHLAEEPIGIELTSLTDPAPRNRHHIGTLTGRCVLKLPAGEWRIRKTSFETSPYWFDEIITVPAGQREHREELTLLEGRRLDLAGKIVRQSDGSPVRGISINVEADTYDVHAVSCSDEHGEFSFSGLWEDKTYIAEACLPRPMSKLGGRLPALRRTVTRDELLAGRFRWEIDAPEARPLVKVCVLVERDGSRLPFTPATFGVEEGRVMRSGMRCARVQVDPDTGLLQVSTPSGSLYQSLQAGNVCYWRALKPGVYVIDCIETHTDPPRTQRGPVSAVEKRFYPIDRDMIFSVPDEGTDVVDLVTVVGEEPVAFALHGKVVDSGGEPLAAASVELKTVSDGEWVARSARSDGNGLFDLDLWKGDWELEVSKEGYDSRHLYRAGHWRHLIPGTSATIILSPAPGPRAAPVERLALIALIALAAGIVSVVGLVALVARGSRRRSRDRS